MKVPKKWSEIVNRLNKMGIPLPMIRDPKTSFGSVSLSLVVISSIWVQLSFVGKISKAFGGLDPESAIYWFLSCSALYFGRKLGGSKAAPQLDAEQPAAPAPKVDSPD